jgi:hypothetical protein
VAADVEWRYLHAGTVRHAFRAGTPITVALCGRYPDWTGHWYGTGTQDEYERAANLRDCAYCAARLNGPT